MTTKVCEPSGRFQDKRVLTPFPSCSHDGHGILDKFLTGCACRHCKHVPVPIFSILNPARVDVH
jgi:hypothetical protein